MADITRAREIHNLIVSLCNQLSAEGYYFRNKAKATRIPEPLRRADSTLVVDRDRIVCALLNKAANTKAAIMTLAEAGHGDDAYALARVITENSIIIAWLLQDDWELRVDTYGLFTASHRARLRELLTKYWEEHADIAELDEATRAITDDLFKGGWSRWARIPKAGEPTKTTKGTFEEMCADLTPPNAKGDRFNMVYDLVYFDTSVYVHSSAASISELTRRLGDKFVIEWLPVKTRAGLAAHISNIAMWFALKAVAEWLRCGFDEELAVLAALMKGADLSEEIV